MYLKQLDILGFKSFADKTRLLISPGITAIVGPNGCGKTNILDALRWVLGEQKVTLLRGSRMEEVIFNGTRDVKPLGMAEVVLTVVNNRGVLPTEYSEVQVARRLFRSGESEYLLNKVPCRLKDIHELFFDTGIGAHSYSVIQQDMIDAVISDKAEERRFLFEEAAGITKYKQRKRAALRKLEATEQDLLRLRDIHAEVQTQSRSLNRQQKKAQRYQKISDDIRNWELYLSAARLREIETQKKQLKAELDSRSDERMTKEAELDRISAQLESDRREQVDLEQELARAGNEVYEVSERAHSLEREVSILVEKRSNARSLIERNLSDIEAFEARSRILEEESRQSEQRLLKQQEEHRTLKTTLAESEAAQSESDRRLLAARSLKEEENRKLIELEGRLSSGKTEDGHLRNREAEHHRLTQALTEQIEAGRANLEQAEVELTEHRARHDKVGEQRASLEATQEQLDQRITQLIERGDELTADIAKHTASLEACEARHNLLRDMIVHYEGYTSGVVSVMEVRERWPGIAGTVAENFVPTEGLEPAMEAALGEMAGFLICDSRRTAEQIVQHLRSENLGKVGMLVPDTGTLNPVVKRPELTQPEFVGWLDSFATTDAELSPLMQAVLARTAVFKAGAEPTEILARLPIGFGAVSTDGIRYSQNVISGGSEDKLPLFRREEKLAEQEQLIADITEKLDQAGRTKDHNTAELGAARAESIGLAEKLETMIEESNSINQASGETEYRRRTLASEISRLENERRDQTAKLETVRNQQSNLALSYDELSSRKESLVDAMSLANRKLQELENAAAQALDQVSKLQVAEVESRSAIEQTESKRSHIRELKQEIKQTTEAKQGEIVRARQEIESAAARIGELENQLQSVFKQRTEATEQQTHMRAAQAETAEQVSRREEQLKEIRSQKDAISDRVHELEIRNNTIESEIQSVVARMREEHDLDIRTTATNKPDDTLPDDEGPAHLMQLKERLRSFGAVNLLALEEYRKACERERFLGEQLQDLTGAKDDLQTTISKINQTARQLFLDTFEKARGNFKKLFVELFSGGEADMFIDDPSDPLESDIQIIARPRGKKLLSITMMSGGERALTSIALLFSLYLVKPSPFCILDEIDAPLDDANCRRFLNIIQTFCRQTQFIIITHNKITMEAAHNLYGVTMEQAGISKQVAVRLTDVAGVAGEEETGGFPTEVPATDSSVPDKVVERLSHNPVVSEDSDAEG